MKPIFHPEAVFSSIHQSLKEKAYSQLIFLVDENTHSACLPVILGELETELPIEIVEMESGEAHKNIDSCRQLWSIFTEYEADRKMLLFNVGGGVITDIGGFVAATYLRGVDFIHFPTSLLAMVDASVGGKTGVDLDHLKNRVGVFAEPKGIYVLPEFLETLPKAQMLSGFAEMLKHGLIADADHFHSLAELNEINTESIEPLIASSVKIKYDIVQKDPKEEGLRKILNFGHTIGHAIETFHLSIDSPILHGFAVAIGMYYESKLAFQLGLLPEKELEKVQKVLSHWYLIPTFSEGEVDEFIQLMYADKKNENNQIYFALIEKIGKCKYNIPVEEKEVKSIFFK